MVGNNIWCKARLAAAETNDRLRSREGAAELIGISPNMLAKYENDLCKCIPVKLYGMGKAFDNTVAILIDISKLDPTYITVKNVAAAASA